jgi:hypothetical protein
MCGMLRAPRKIGRRCCSGGVRTRSRGAVARCVGWLVDRPSKRQRARDKPPDWVGGGSGCSLGAKSRLVSPGAAKSSLRYPARHGGKAYPSAGRPSETTERGVLRALRDKVRGQRARAWTPCSSPRGRRARSERRIGCLAMYIRQRRVFGASLQPLRPSTGKDRRVARDAINCAPKSPQWSTPWPTRPSSPRARAASA